MRLAPLALLAALAPSACLSGFSEIRVQGGGVDASSDRAAADTAPRDAGEDRAQLADAGDVTADAPTPPEEAADAPAVPDVVAPVDLGAPDAFEADVVDGGAWDAGEDRTEPADVQVVDGWASADTPAAPDVVDAGACPGGCSAGEVCEAGRCGRWTYRGETRAAVADIMYTRDAAVVAARFDETCAAAFAGARACRSTDVALEEGARLCAQGGPLYFADLDVPPNTGAFSSRCLDCLADGGSPYLTLCTLAMNRLACCAFSPR